MRHTGSKLSNGSDEATCQQIRSCVTPVQKSVTVLIMPRVRRLKPASHRIKTPQRCRLRHMSKYQRNTWTDDVAGQPDPFCRSRAKKERGARTARWYAWAVWTLALVGACGHAGRRFFAGVSTVDSSGCPLHDGMFKNTF